MTMQSTLNVNDQATAQNDAGRETNGRFKLGNKGGPGNPNAGKLAIFRQRMIDRLTPEIMDIIIDQLVTMSLEGHWQAMKLLLSYSLGKPQAMPAFVESCEPPVESRPGDAVEASTPQLSPNEENREMPAPSPDGEFREVLPIANGDFHEAPPSANGDFSPPLNRQQRRALKKAERLAKRARNTPKPVTQRTPDGLVAANG